MDDLIASSARAVASLAPAIVGLESADEELALAQRAIERGHFLPDEEERLRAWFARYLTVRLGLLETIDDLAPIARMGGPVATDAAALRAFLIAYTAASLLVRSARFLVGRIATHKVVQRKLNEAAPRHRIPRKQYTTIRRSLTRPRNAWRLRQAMQFADRHRASLEALGSDRDLATVITYLAESEPSLHAGVVTYVKARLRYRLHSWRRRRASAVQQALFGVFEAFGRVIADARMPRHRARLGAASRDAIAALLQPGDVIVTRHDRVLSNLFLPGYWPHAALYIGPPGTRDALQVDVDAERAARWIEPLCVLEARKDGVRLRALDDTLDVDVCTVLRPRVDDRARGVAITNALAHEGKLYNFDFDFFTDDKLVCTEVIYRAFDGVGGITFTLERRSGRVTLSAEDLLDMAVEGRGFDVVAIFGTPNVGERLVTGTAATDALLESYRGADDLGRSRPRAVSGDDAGE